MHFIAVFTIIIFNFNVANIDEIYRMISAISIAILAIISIILIIHFGLKYESIIKVIILLISAALIHVKFNDEYNYTGGELEQYIDPGFNEKERNIIIEKSNIDGDINSYVEVNLDPEFISGWTYRKMKKNILRSNLHRGQRKLFLAELDFLLSVYNQQNLFEQENVNILYVGAAPGVHIPLLSKYFPNAIWTLIDPSKSIVENGGKFNVLRGFFSDKNQSNQVKMKGNIYYAEDYANITDIFINDARVTDPKNDYLEDETDPDIRLDQESTLRWTEIIKPKHGSLLKFRPPYTDKEIDIFEDGILRTQVWAPQGSTESRLWMIGPSNYRRKTISNSNYENYFAYFNFVARKFISFIKPLKDVPGMCWCVDCGNEYRIWDKMIKTHKGSKPKSISSGFLKLNKVLNQPLNGNFPHGFGDRMKKMKYRRKELIVKFPKLMS
jgi:hypothetical protein